MVSFTETEAAESTEATNTTEDTGAGADSLQIRLQPQQSPQSTEVHFHEKLSLQGWHKGFELKDAKNS